MRQPYLLILLSAALGLHSSLDTLPAEAQAVDNPNMKNFYMARRQIQITDDRPAINDMRTQPGALVSSGATAAGSGAAPLPSAGFNSYYSPAVSPARSLPRVETGLPKAPPPPSVPKALTATGKKGSFKKPAPVTTAASKPSAPKVAGSYSNYQTYPAGSVAPNLGISTSTKVKGSVLNWNSSRKPSY